MCEGSVKALGRSLPLYACQRFQLEPLGDEVEGAFFCFAGKGGIKEWEGPLGMDLNVSLSLPEALLVVDFPVAFSRFL